MKYIVKFFTQWVSLLVLILLVPAVNGQTVHVAHCAAGCPQSSEQPGAAGNEIVVRHLFAASINSENGVADWVAYRVLADSVGVASLLPRFWLEDNLLSSQLDLGQIADSRPRIVQPELTEEEDRSYGINEIIFSTEDQGRLAPMSSFAGTPYWTDLNYISNLAPLPNDLRVGSWSRLDQAANELAARVGEVFVVSGPLYRIQNTLSTSPDSSAAQPSAFFKVVVAGSSQATFLFPQDLAQHARYCDQLSNLQIIEQEAGLTLFPEQQFPIEENLSKELGCNN